MRGTGQYRGKRRRFRGKLLCFFQSFPHYDLSDSGPKASRAIAKWMIVIVVSRLLSFPAQLSGAIQK